VTVAKGEKLFGKLQVQLRYMGWLVKNSIAIASRKYFLFFTSEYTAWMAAGKFLLIHRL
jgi:hypothetical protein